MNPESLIGKELGTCKLQKLIGQGGMGAVFLAQQSRPKRQVAVKVLLPVNRLNPGQQVAFLERFRRETDAAASLEHPNILPVHEYGERDGLAYLVMPYVSGGTMRDELEREGALPLVKVVNYLDQLAAALDVAHGRGVIHRDIKPANILMTAEGRLLLTDFGLVKVIAEGQPSQVSLTGAGVPLGTPDYMAPEQVIGGDVDTRADLYALGVVLYQMVTGRTPFKGNMPMQVAMQHLHSSPPPPSTLREDLPATAEQVMLRVLAKNPADRYMSAQDLASAFRLALAVSGVELTPQTVGGAGPLAPGAETRFFTPRGLFDPSWQTGSMPVVEPKRRPNAASPAVSTASLVPRTARTSGGVMPAQEDIVAKTSMTMPSLSDFISSTSTYNANTPAPIAPESSPVTSVPTTSARDVRDAKKTGNTSPMTKHRMHKTGLMRATDTPAVSTPDVPKKVPPAPLVASSMPSSEVGTTERKSPPNPISPLPINSTSSIQSAAPPTQGNTGVLMSTTNGEQGNTTTMRLAQSFKVIQVPIAGQPGYYVTGLLPMLPQTQDATSTPEPPAEQAPSLPPILADLPWQKLSGLRKHARAILVIVVVSMLLLTSVTFWLARSHTTDGRVQETIKGTPNATATMATQATATEEADIILSDPLSSNTHNWPVSTGGSQLYIFENKAYHITNNDTKSSAIALLPEESLNGSFVYSLNMEEIQGDESTVSNQFGIIFRFSVHQKNGQTYKAFYIFEVSNSKGGSYELLKYDDSTNASSPWSTLWSNPFGSEYHFGHGSQAVNTLKVAVNGNKFTMIVNGKQVGTARDSSLTSGQVGMLVNWKGTEVAFSDLLLTYA